MKAVFLIDDSPWHQRNLAHFLKQIKEQNLSLEPTLMYAGSKPLLEELQQYPIDTIELLGSFLERKFSLSLLPILQLAEDHFGKFHYRGIPVVKLFFPLFYQEPIWVLDTDLYLLPNTPNEFFHIEAKAAGAPEEPTGAAMDSKIERAINVNINGGVIYWNWFTWSEMEKESYCKFLTRILTPSSYSAFASKIFTGEQGQLNWFFAHHEMRWGPGLLTVLPQEYNLFLPDVLDPKTVLPQKEHGIFHFKGADENKVDWIDFETKLSSL